MIVRMFVLYFDKERVCIETVITAHGYGYYFLFFTQANIKNIFFTGFIKLALRCGTDLLPSFAFGEQLIYNYPNNDAGKYIANDKLYWQTQNYIRTILIYKNSN